MVRQAHHDKMKKTPEIPKQAESNIMKESKYKIGDEISFKRNEKILSNNCLVVAIEELALVTFGGTIPESFIYIIENENGFSPNEFRIEKYKLNKDKKYLFIKESEAEIAS